MSFQYRIFCYEPAASPMLAQELAARLQGFVQPLLVILDAYLDKREVAHLCGPALHHRRGAPSPTRTAAG